MNKHIRYSNFEFLRIIAMLMIVLYHLLYQFVYGTTQIPIYRALWLPLHIGVVIFILISGYFNIKPSISGLFNLMIKVIVLVVPLQFISIYQNSNNIFNAFTSILFISHSPLWYVRIYICLYIISPIINIFLRTCSIKQRFLAILGIGYISCIYGTISVDYLFVNSDGKNLINFILIYIIGDTIRYYNQKLLCISTHLLIILYIILNTIVVLFYLLFFYDLTGAIIFKLAYSYNSPFLIINAILLFLIVSRWKIQSSFINIIAKSVFSVYLLQESPLILWSLIVPITKKIMVVSYNPYILLPCLVLYTLIIFCSILCIDKLLNPIWKLSSNVGKKLEFKFNKLWKK